MTTDRRLNLDEIEKTHQANPVVGLHIVTQKLIELCRDQEKRIAELEKLAGINDPYKPVQ